MRHPVVSFSIAHTSILTSPLLSRASCNSYHIFTFHACTVEPLRPLYQGGLVEPLLLQGKRESEAQGKNFILNFSVQDKIGKTVCNMVKQFNTRTSHHTVGNGKNLAVH